MTNQEQPGQVSPSGELRTIYDKLGEWMLRHDSEGEPFKTAIRKLREARNKIGSAIWTLKQESPHEH